MSKILFEVKNLISEVTINNVLVAGGIASTAALLGASVYLGIPLLLALSKSILNFLVFCIVIDGSVKLTALSIEKIKWLTDIDGFLKENYERLKLNGYNNIEVIERKALNARDQVIKECNEQFEVESEDDKLTYHILKLKCSKRALLEYMQVSLSELFIYYVRLLDVKRIDNSKATSLDYILSHQEEAPFNLVLTKITTRFKNILDLIDQDVDKFENDVLQKIKSQIKSSQNTQKPDTKINQTNKYSFQKFSNGSMNRQLKK